MFNPLPVFQNSYQPRSVLPLTVDAPAVVPAARPETMPATLLVLALVGFGIGVVLAIQDTWLNLSFDDFAFCISLCAVVCLAGTARLVKGGVSSAPFVFLVVFSVFHFGALVIFGLGIPFSDAQNYTLQQWFFSSDTQLGGYLSLLGLLGATLGVFLGQIKFGTGQRQVFPALVSSDRLAGWLGIVILGTCLAAWFGSVWVVGGSSVFTGSYESFLLATSDTNLSWLYFGIGFGLVWLACTTEKRIKQVGLGAFIGWALIALPLGLRGEVLFPGVTYWVLSRRSETQKSAWKVAILGLCLLSVISALRVIREVGVENVQLASLTASPSEAMVELGSSLRPVSTVVTWTENGDEFLNGASYWAPIDRALVWVIPGWGRVNAEDDDRILNVQVMKRVGPIGFSPVAEAYYNFGPLGVVIAMMITGWLIGWISGFADSPLNRALLGVTFLPVLIQIRNSFVAVPFQLIVGLATVWMIYWLCGWISYRKSLVEPAVLTSDQKKYKPSASNQTSRLS
ncbi:MAG TPA: O-antigen polysaccharide polymerase Wzy [Acidobacteriota bacterium]|nr:O-antigen polysaccharide polymerase Wzy [Acidobacteriota bacterium]